MSRPGCDLDLPDGYVIVPLVDVAVSSVGLRNRSGWRAEILCGEEVRVALSNGVSFAWRGAGDPEIDLARAVERCISIIEAFRSGTVIDKVGALGRRHLGVQLGEEIVWGQRGKSATWFSPGGPWSQTATAGARALSCEGFAGRGLTTNSGLLGFVLADGKRVDLHNSDFVRLSQQSAQLGHRLILEFEVDNDFPQEWITLCLTLDQVTLFDWLPDAAAWPRNSMQLEDFSWDGAWDFQLQFADYSVGLCAQSVRVAAT